MEILGKGSARDMGVVGCALKKVGMRIFFPILHNESFDDPASATTSSAIHRPLFLELSNSGLTALKLLHITPKPVEFLIASPNFNSIFSRVSYSGRYSLPKHVLLVGRFSVSPFTGTMWKVMLS
jgi:hypothetical protein